LPGSRINSVYSQQRVAAHALGAAINASSLIDIKTGAAMMWYAGTCALSASWETVKPSISKAIRGSAYGLAEDCGSGIRVSAQFEVLTGFKWARWFGCSAGYHEKSFP
jgi:hypothetical protein